MRLLLPVFLLLSFQLLAQSPQREKLSTDAAYELAIQTFIQNHGIMVYNTQSDLGKVLFIKKQAHTETIKDTINGVLIRKIETNDVQTFAEYFFRKQDVFILDVQPIVMRDINASIWILPMKSQFNAKKKTVSEPKYQDKTCQYIFDYSEDRSRFWYFKEAKCAE